MPMLRAQSVAHKKAQRQVVVRQELRVLSLAEQSER